MRTDALYRRWGAVACCVLLLLLVSDACGQPAAARFQHLGIADGLPQNTVTAIKEDITGFIWFGTNGGLCRYDGYECKTFRHTATVAQSLPNNHVNCMEGDGAGKLLIGTDNGLSLLTPETEAFEPVAGGRGLIIRKIKTDSRKRIWVGTSDGVMEYDAGRKKLVPIAVPGLSHYGEEVSSIEEDDTHDIWVAHFSRRLFRFNPVTGQQRPLPAALLADTLLHHATVTTLKRDSRGNLWLGTVKQGIAVITPGEQVCLRAGEPGKESEYSFERIRDILFKGDEVWVAARNGLFCMNQQGKHITRFLSDKYETASLSNSSICALLQDRSGVLWIGTYLGGVNYLQPGNHSFAYIDRLTKGGGLSSKVVYALAEDKTGNWWIGTGGGGINYYEPRASRFRYYRMNSDPRSSEPDYVRALCITQDTIWAGSLSGLFAADSKRRVFTNMPLEKSGVPARKKRAVFALEQDGKRGVWIGTQLGLMHRDNHGNIRCWEYGQPMAGGLAAGEVQALKQDREGGLWIGRSNGLSYLQRGTDSIVNFSDIAELAYQGISAIKEDSKGVVWIGTDENGLVYFDRQHRQFGNIDRALGLADQSVRGIVEDNEGNIWVSGINGISRLVRKKAAPPYTANDLVIDRFSVENGLRSNEFISAAHKTREGKLVFGGYDGIAILQPGDMPGNQYRPPVVITDFQINNQPVAMGAGNSPLQASITYTKQITLPYNQAYFSLRFAALNFVHSHSNRFAYTLEGLKNDTWHYAGNERTATYTNLAPGNYVFKVKAANNNGVWNTQCTTLHITVLPPVWRTWYAYLLYVMLVVGLLYLFYAYSLKANRLRHQLQLQHAINEKEKEFAEQKMEFFTNISHEIKTPLTLILAPLEKLVKGMAGGLDGKAAAVYLPMMQRNGDKLMKMVNQLLEFRRLETGFMTLDAQQQDIVMLVQLVLDNFESLAVKKRIQLVLEAPEGPLMVLLDADKWERVVDNLVSNAVKFTQEGGTVIVRLAVVNDNQQVPFFEMQVADNGPGITPAHLANIFAPFHYYDKATANGSGIGLSYTRSLVTLHGGTIAAESRLRTESRAGCTVFTVKLPYTANKKRSLLHYTT